MTKSFEKCVLMFQAKSFEYLRVFEMFPLCMIRSSKMCAGLYRKFVSDIVKKFGSCISEYLLSRYI